MYSNNQQHETIAVLPPKFGGGPKGVGDPNDRTLRRVEREVLIPKIMREKAKAEHCLPEVQAFESCCKQNSLLMVAFCRTQNNTLKGCLEKWYKDDKFKSECTEIYLKDRAEFRSTGLQKKHRNLINPAN